MNNIHCLNNISAKGTALLGDQYNLVDEINDAQAILVRSAAMHDMEFSENLLAIARAGAGVNNIPLERAAEQGIVVFNTPGANANAVKELVLAGLFMGARDIIGGAAWCRENADDPNIAKTAEKAKKAFAGSEISGKKLGVIGLGAIGAKVANAAIELGMQVYGYDPYVSVGAAWRLSSRVKHITNVDDIYRECDFITIHVPATPQTKGMVNADAFRLMKPEAVILNFSRDTLVNNNDIAAALETDMIRGYVTDFATPEVMKMKKTVVLPHLGASTYEAEDNCAMMAVRQVRDYIENGNITNSVNYPAVNAGFVAEGDTRLVILHTNTPAMISQITNIFSSENANIDNLTNKSRGENAVTILDLDDAPTAAALDALKQIQGIRRVRVIA